MRANIFRISIQVNHKLWCSFNLDQNIVKILCVKYKSTAIVYREYDENITAFIAKNPGYVPPQHKSFLTQEDQKILDKFMGRPEKPPSSAYSLFSKEMLNNVEIKKFPSKERMAQISEKWKILPQEQKDM